MDGGADIGGQGGHVDQIAGFAHHQPALGDDESGKGDEAEDGEKKSYADLAPNTQIVQQTHHRGSPPVPPDPVPIL